MVQEALANNRNLRATALRLRAAREDLITSKARLLPNADARTGYSASTGKNVSSADRYSLNFGVNWEADVWGRLRDRDAAAQADFASDLADQRGRELSLAANTAQAWCDLVTAQKQLDLARATLASYKRALPAVRRGYEASTLRAVDLQFARNNIANAERTLRQRELGKGNAARNLEVFLGRYPAAEISAGAELPELTGKVPAGLPARLLSRRPDLVSAASQVYRSARLTAAARKDLLPRLRISSDLSNNGQQRLSRVFDPNFILFSAAANLTQTLYDGGTLKARARAALLQNRASLESYAQTALNAFREVESALHADTSLREQEVYLSQEAEQTTRAEKRALRDITLGIPGATFLEYLEAQRRAENARASLIRLRNQRLQNRIDLYLALGGGY